MFSTLLSCHHIGALKTRDFSLHIIARERVVSNVHTVHTLWQHLIHRWSAEPSLMNVEFEDMTDEKAHSLATPNTATLPVKEDPFLPMNNSAC